MAHANLHVIIIITSIVTVVKPMIYPTAAVMKINVKWRMRPIAVRLVIANIHARVVFTIIMDLVRPIVMTIVANMTMPVQAERYVLMATVNAQVARSTVVRHVPFSVQIMRIAVRVGMPAIGVIGAIMEIVN